MFRKLTAVMALVSMLIALSSCTGIKIGNSGPGNNQTTKQANESNTLGNASDGTANNSGTSGNVSGKTISDGETSSDNDKVISGLKSYHSSMTITVKGKTEDEDAKSRVEEYNVKEPMAKHVINSNNYIDKKFMIMSEMIMIGKDTWFKVAGSAWEKETNDSSDDNNNMFEDDIINQDVNQKDMVRIGNEKISGVNCVHYTYKGSISGSSVDGEFWIANDKDIKNVVIKENATTTYTSNDEKTLTYMEYLMDQINENIKIEPPKDVGDISGSAENTSSVSPEEETSAAE